LYISIYSPPGEAVNDITCLEMTDTLDFIDMIEDPDDIPSYTGCFDYSGF
jgi:hypothetical protein